MKVLEIGSHAVTRHLMLGTPFAVAGKAAGVGGGAEILAFIEQLGEDDRRRHVSEALTFEQSEQLRMFGSSVSCTSSATVPVGSRR
ncbi:MAG: hypothetical protein ABIT61_01635 [Steroidobacteraceae bacterium]